MQEFNINTKVPVKKSKLPVHDFAKISKNLARFRSENNFIGLK